MKCRECEGHGIISGRPCRSCKGTGQDLTDSGNGGPDCEACGGSTFVFDSDQDQWVPCPYCKQRVSRIYLKRGRLWTRAAQLVDEAGWLRQWDPQLKLLMRYDDALGQGKLRAAIEANDFDRADQICRAYNADRTYQWMQQDQARTAEVSQMCDDGWHARCRKSKQDCDCHCHQ